MSTEYGIRRLYGGIVAPHRVRRMYDNKDYISCDSRPQTSVIRITILIELNNSYMVYSPLKCGFVGLGNIAHSHAAHLKTLDNVSLAGGFDVSADAQREFQEEHGGEAFDSFDQMIESVDAVFVCTPNQFHENYVINCLDRGIPVYCEKPLAHTLESAERISEAADHSTSFCMLGFHNRFKTAAVEAVEARESGRLGEITQVDAKYIRRRGIPARGSWFTREDTAGGGALVDIGVHALDLALHLAGFPEVIEVSGQTRSLFGIREDYTYEEMHGTETDPAIFDVDDSVVAMLRCADGTVITLDAAWAANRPDSRNFVVRGVDSGAWFKLGEPDITFYDVNRESPPNADPLPEETITGTARSGRLHAHKMFVDAALTDSEPEWNTVEEAMQVQEIIDAIYTSSETGESVQLQ